MGVATTMLVIGAVGLATQAYGQVKAGSAAKKAGEAEGARQDFNAQVAEQQADDALARGREEEGRFRSEVRGLIGSQRTGFAGQGVRVDVGSAAEVQQDAARLGDIDAKRIRANAAREAWGFRVQAQDARMGGDTARRGGAAAQSAARIGAVGSVLAGGSSLIAQRYGWNGRG